VFQVPQDDISNLLTERDQAIGIVLQLADGSIASCNRAAENILGMTIEQMQDASATSSPWQTIYRDGTPFPVDRYPVMVALRTGEPCLNVEMGFYRPDGQLIWFKVDAQPLFRRGENPPYAVISIIAAINDELEAERAQYERRFREAEERLQIGVHVAGIGLARFDYASSTVMLTPEAAALYGIPPTELMITHARIHDTFHPEERETLEEIIQQVLDPAGPGWFDTEHRVVWPMGEVRWLSVRKQVFFDRSGETPRADYAILAAIDITDRKRAEATARAQLTQIEAIYASAPVGLCFLDRDRRFIQLNSKLADMNGLSVSEHLGRTVREILPDLAETQEPIFQQVLATGIPVTDVEVQGTTPAQPGVDRYWLVNYYPLMATDGQVLGINIMVQEITERKQAEQERERLLSVAETARAEAEAANQSKDEFVAQVAHELRSPLNSVVGWAKLLQNRTFDEAMLDKALSTIVRNTEVQVQLIEDLLDISRIVRGTLEIEKSPIELINVVEAALNLVRPIATSKQTQLTTSLLSSRQVMGDPNRLQQIVVNLLTNAIKFTPAEGRVEVELIQTSDQIQLKVKDTGKGIAAEFLPFIFERYQQGQRKTGTKEGLGLGLAIVKHLVELHSGRITVESLGEGLGSTFTVQLPLLDTIDAGSVYSAEQSNLNSLDGVRILVVDDESDQLDLLAFVLSREGAVVQSARSGNAALKLLSQSPFDILVSDLAMPDGNGYELLQQLSSTPNAAIPTIAFTAYASTTHQEMALQTGFQRHLTKPLDPDVLISTILCLLQGR
jgi:PAS domain S-box-containing protein